MSRFQPPFYYDNTVQLLKKAMRLETLTVGAIGLASHADGFGGVAFPKFLGELLFELGVSERHEMVQLLRDVEGAGWTQIVPFLSPPNEKWPTWLNDSSVRFGNLYRTRNNDSIDFQTTPSIISGECSAVAFPVIEDILKRVPANTTIHLVVVNTLQDGYFTEESWGTFVRKQRLQNVDFYRISKGSTLQGIEGMPNQSTSTMTTADKLVLFIEREKN
ncbi:hypothetical protein V7S43_007460 [Phytophthora oleae]|uniref:Uncharacterized protein n=1 Tax=Phytophthora oleae TaxID=2107226 RepID=A0ABD3FNN1_9STRA